MIAMVCPACGRKGNIPENKVNTRLHCKKCDAVFHLNSAGTVVLGEPETAESRARMHGKVAGHLQGDPIEDAVKRVKQLPKPLRYGAGLSAVVLGALFMLPAFGFRMLPEPETPETVAKRAAQALLIGDEPTLRWLATPETSADVPSWLAVRSTLFPGLSDGPLPKTAIDAKPVADQVGETRVRDEASVLVFANAETKTPQIFVVFFIELAKVGRRWKVDVSATKSLSPALHPSLSTVTRRAQP